MYIKRYVSCSLAIARAININGPMSMVRANTDVAYRSSSMSLHGLSDTNDICHVRDTLRSSKLSSCLFAYTRQGYSNEQILRVLVAWASTKEHKRHAIGERSARFESARTVETHSLYASL